MIGFADNSDDCYGKENYIHVTAMVFMMEVMTMMVVMMMMMKMMMMTTTTTMTVMIMTIQQLMGNQLYIKAWITTCLLTF
jgi:hypothetical protein